MKKTRQPRFKTENLKYKLENEIYQSVLTIEQISYKIKQFKKRLNDIKKTENKYYIYERYLKEIEGFTFYEIEPFLNSIEDLNKIVVSGYYSILKKIKEIEEEIKMI